MRNADGFHLLFLLCYTQAVGAFEPSGKAMAMALWARIGLGQRWLPSHMLVALSSLLGTSVGRGFGFGKKNWKKWRRTVSHPVSSFAFDCAFVFVRIFLRESGEVYFWTP